MSTVEKAPEAVVLNPLTLPLHGHQLIEASAGTGKTWTIAALYLRLLLGHGQDGSKHKQPLTVDQILVVTFTEAATAELRDRVRGRIHEARLAFREGKSEDGFVQTLINESDDHGIQEQRLLAAERQMDEAAIFTIHGFCQRMLKQHAFESGTLFTSDLMEDQSELIADTVADFWRRTMYPMDREFTTLTRGIWSGPQALQKSLDSWLHQHDLRIDERMIPQSLDALRKQMQEIREIKARWVKDRESIENELGKVLNKRRKPWSRLKDMAVFASSDSLVPEFNKESGWSFYTPDALQAACNKGKEPPNLHIFQRIDALSRYPLPVDEAFKALMLRDALKDVQRRLIQRRAELRKMSFDDLLTRMDEALQSSGGETLAHHIRQLYPVAMIDEFQDTDSVQYRIFSELYPINSEEHASDSNDSGLFLIGDPKQAIYAFRGADIFTYIQARRQIPNHYTLPRNWRSSESMISATNHLFEQAKSAFIYDEDIPFLPVEASPSAKSRGLFLDGEPQAAMQLWHHDNAGSAIGNGEYGAAMSEATANQINELLTLAKDGRCQLGSGSVSDSNGENAQRDLAPQDIAVLVRTGTQAEQVRNALSAQGIDSVYLSDRSSVFSSAEALDLSRILTACLEPTNERALRAALATQLMGQQASDLDQLNHDEQRWEEAVEEFTGYHDTWINTGILPMVRRLLVQRELAERLLASHSTESGERRLTDLLHLGELLATAAREKETPHALLRWFNERIAEPDTSAKDQQMHLESERQLVQIVTIHKSKGLEYGIVFLPFACTWRGQDKGIYHDDQQQVIADLTGQEEALEKADRERLAEDLRLMYVALTRSVHACYMGIAPLKQRAREGEEKTELSNTAFGFLLANGDAITTTSLKDGLESLAANCSSIVVSKLPEKPAANYIPPKEDEPELNAREFTGSIPRNWWMTSYSALSRHAEHRIVAVPTPDASGEVAGLDIEVQGQNLQDTLTERPAFSSLLDFPRGATPGTFLHDIFEHVAFENPDPDIINPMIKEKLLVNGFEEEWLPVLSTMVQETVHATMNDDSLSLAQLQAGNYLPELEFHLRLGNLQAPALNKLLKQYDPLAAQAGDLRFPDVQGLLKGFIDLTFQHNGRWYVLDWKSNWLGESTSAYTQSAMADAMIDHRYDLQYLIYTLALHRLLKNRLPDYDYEQHLGGAFYIFLRGIQTTTPEERTGIYFHRPQKELINAMDAFFDGKDVNAEANVC